jgi:hypothetical protein
MSQALINAILGGIAGFASIIAVIFAQLSHSRGKEVEKQKDRAAEATRVASQLGQKIRAERELEQKHQAENAVAAQKAEQNDRSGLGGSW